MNPTYSIEYSMPEKAYRKHPAWSQSDLKVAVRQSPYHALHRKKCYTEPTAEMVFGSRFHTYVLEPEKAKENFAYKPEGMSFASREGKAWKEDNWDKDIISHEDHLKMVRMYSALLDNEEAERLLINTKTKELSLFADVLGVPVKCRLDSLGDCIGDLKTCRDASPNGALKSLFEFGYDFQAAFYLHLLELCGEDYRPFRFVFQEKDEPHAVAVYELSDQLLTRGKVNFIKAINLIKECITNNHWPAYGTGVQILTIQ